jgi:hypothetical protein
LIGAEGASSFENAKRRIYSCGAFSGELTQRPAGTAGQERPRNRFSDEEAHRARPAESEHPRDRQKAPISAMLILRSFPLCPCDDYSKKLPFVERKSTTLKNRNLLATALRKVLFCFYNLSEGGTNYEENGTN